MARYRGGSPTAAAGGAWPDERSAHFADQAHLFVRRELEPVWRTEAEVRAHLEREYVPGNETR